MGAKEKHRFSVFKLQTKYETKTATNDTILASLWKVEGNKCGRVYRLKEDLEMTPWICLANIG